MISKLSSTGRTSIVLATASALVAVVMLPTLALPSAAFAVDETRTYTWHDGQARPAVPQTITGSNGQTLYLTSQGNPVQSSAAQTVTQNFTRAWDGTCGAGELGNIINITPKTMHVDENGFVGDIPLVGNISYYPVTRVDSYHDTKTDHYQGITKDFEIPATKTFATADGPRVYQRTDVKYEDVLNQWDEPTGLYNATVTYSCDVERQVFDHYNIHAEYAGTLAKTVPGGDWSLTATYHADDPAPTPVPENAQPVPENTQPAPDPNANANTEVVATPPNTNENANVNPFENGMNRNGNATNGNTGSNENGGGTESEKQEFPLIPVIGGGIGALALIGIIAALLARRKKKSDKPSAADTALAAAAAATATEEAAAAIEDEPVCQLFTVVKTEEGYDQDARANLSLDVSGDAEIPSVIRFPEMIDDEGNQIRFVKDEGADYWIALEPEVVESAVSDQLIVATSDGQEIYRGKIAQQFQVDADRLVDSLNNAISPEERRDISEELAAYAAITDTAEPEGALTTADDIYASAEDFDFDETLEGIDDDDDYRPFEDITVDIDDSIDEEFADADGFAKDFDDELDFSDAEIPAAAAVPAAAAAADFDDFADFDDDDLDFSDAIAQPVQAAQQAASGAVEGTKEVAGNVAGEVEQAAGNVVAAVEDKAKDAAELIDEFENLDFDDINFDDALSEIK